MATCASLRECDQLLATAWLRRFSPSAVPFGAILGGNPGRTFATLLSVFRIHEWLKTRWGRGRALGAPVREREVGVRGCARGALARALRAPPPGQVRAPPPGQVRGIRSVNQIIDGEKKSATMSTPSSHHARCVEHSSTLLIHNSSSTLLIVFAEGDCSDAEETTSVHCSNSLQPCSRRHSTI